MLKQVGDVTAAIGPLVARVDLGLLRAHLKVSCVEIRKSRQFGIVEGTEANSSEV
jgi:hypothetical protein